jgi:SAM-dependent methyltransferase
MLTDAQDAYGHQLTAFLKNQGGYEIVERDDGYIDISSGPESYFAPYSAWPQHQKEALRFAQERVVDIGAGAGRVSLYLQDQGREVLAIDNSPLAIEVCRGRGVARAEVIPVTRISSRTGIFDTIVMFGNNFGLFGNVRRARWLLRRFHKMTTKAACILAESNNPHLTENPHHLAYQESNLQRGRLAGQLRIRVRFQKYKTPWFEYLLVSGEEMRAIVSGTGWRVDRLFSSQGSSFSALIVKDPKAVV